MIRIRDIDHLVLRVVDLETMLRFFYCDVPGCSIERRQNAIGLVQLRARSSRDMARKARGRPCTSRIRRATSWSSTDRRAAGRICRADWTSPILSDRTRDDHRRAVASRVRDTALHAT